MSTGWVVVVLLVALALASVSVRALLQLSAPERPRRLLLLGVSAGLGVLVTGVVVEWAWWPVGLVVGLGVVEVGPAVASGVRALVRRKGGDL